MKIAGTYSHLNGLEHLLIRKKRLWTEITSVIKAVEARDEHRHNPIALKRQLRDAFRARQWCEQRVTYWVADDGYPLRPTIAPTAGAQKREIERMRLTPIRRAAKFDLVKERTAVGIQPGATALLAEQLFAKHQALYMRDKMDVGIEIFLLKKSRLRQSSLPDCYEHTIYNAIRHQRGLPSVPLVVIGIVP